MSTTDDSWQSISLHTYRRDFCFDTAPFIFENGDDDMTMTLVRNGIDTFVEMPNAWPCVVVFKKRLSWRMWCRHWDSIITKKKRFVRKLKSQQVTRTYSVLRWALSAAPFPGSFNGHMDAHNDF